MLVVGLLDIQHIQSVIKGVFFFLCLFKNCYYFSDLETQWPRNPELKFACLQHLSEGVSHNIEEKKSQLCFRANSKREEEQEWFCNVDHGNQQQHNSGMMRM